MNAFVRILITINSFILAVLSFLVFLITLNESILEKLYDNFLSGIESHGLLIALFSVVVFILSIIFLLSGLKTDSEKKSIGKLTEIGEIKISLLTLENIALTAAKNLEGIKDAKSNVSVAKEGVIITIKTTVLSDIIIPDLSEQIQKTVKKSVEATSGVKVEQVRVLIESICSNQKLRVE